MTVLKSGSISTMRMPEFNLPDFGGEVRVASELVGENGTLVVFMCNHCPFVQHIADGLGRLADSLQDRKISTVGINSNDPERVPEDGAAQMREFAAAHRLAFPYLVDLEQSVARAFGAVCTPDFFLFDRHWQLYYRGQMDESRPSNDREVTGADLVRASDLMLAGAAAPSPQWPSIGCSIKWRRSDELA